MTKAIMKQKYVGYARVSTSNQRDEKTIEIQERALKEYAEQNNYDLVKIFRDDGISGGLEDRAGLAEMFNFLEDKNNKTKGVLIYKLDRLARDLYLSEHLIKKLEELNIRLVSTKERDLGSKDPMRKAFRQFMGIVAELEKSFITMRLKAGRLNKLRKGGFPGGGVALGYEVVDSDLVKNDEAIKTVRQIYYLKRYKRMTLTEIAKNLNQNSIKTPKGGKKWYAGTIKYILNNKVYRGRLIYSDKEAKRGDLSLILNKNLTS